MGVKIPTDIPNAAYPTAGQGLVLDSNGQLPLAVRRLLPGFEYVYAEYAANVLVTATTEATANTIVTATTTAVPATIFDGQTAVWVRFFAPFMKNDGTRSTLIWLYDALNGAAAASIGELGGFDTTVANFGQTATYGHRFTPAAGSHVFSVRGSVGAASTTTVVADIGGAGKFFPGWVSITRA